MLIAVSRSERRVFAGFILLIACLLLVSAGGAASAAPAFADIPLRELPQNGSLSATPTTLRKLAAKLSAGGQVKWAAVYLWFARSDLKEPVQPVFTRELEALQEEWDLHPAAITPISIVIVFADSEADRQKVYARIQESARGRHRVPIYVGVDNWKEFWAALVNEWRLPPSNLLLLPELFCIDLSSLSIQERRGDDPVKADAWIRQFRGEHAQSDAAGASPAEATMPPAEEPEGIPPDCAKNWFRRQIARVVSAGIIDLKEGKFCPEEQVTQAEFLGWLGRLFPGRSTAALLEASEPDEEFTRERAITALMRFLYGRDPLAELGKCPPPAGESSSWQQAFNLFSGSENANRHLQPYLILALAKGFLYYQPSLHAQWPLTRQHAAWLLAAALEPAAGSGLVVDAIDLPLTPDRRYGMSELHYPAPSPLSSTDSAANSAKAPPSKSANPAGSPESTIRLYPTYASARTPMLAEGYPAVLYVSQDALSDSISRAAEWLRMRSGSHPLTLRAQRLLGEYANAQDVVISADDAEMIRAQNRATGLMDFWRVTFVTGVGASLLGPREAMSRDKVIELVFSVPMNPDTLREDTVWLERVGWKDRIPTRLIRRESQYLLTPQYTMISLEPAQPLEPGADYRIVLSDQVKSADGVSIYVRKEEGVREGEARRLAFTAARQLHISLSVLYAPEGTSITLPDLGKQYTAPVPAIDLYVEPGPLQVEFDPPGQARISQTVMVEKDGPAQVVAVSPKPAKLIAQVTPLKVKQGEEVSILVQAVDNEGRLLPHHDPVQVTMDLDIPGAANSFTVSNGEGRFALRLDRPGRHRIFLRAAQGDISILPAAVEVSCRYLPERGLGPAWVERESHTLSRAGSAQEILVSPRLRRWLALDKVQEIRVLDTDGLAFRYVSRAPGREDFSTDDNGYFHFFRGCERRTVEISYPYRKARCAVLVSPSRDILAGGLQEVMTGLLLDSGYYCLSPDELKPALDPDGPEEIQFGQVRESMDLFGLQDIFIVRLTPQGKDSYAVSFTIWWSSSVLGSEEEIKIRPPWVSTTDGREPLRVRINRGAERLFDENRLRAQIVEALKPWFDLVGLYPRALSEGRR